jgi:hypothetical protein
MGGVDRMPLAGGTVEHIVVPDTYPTTGIAVDATHLYYMEGDYSVGTVYRAGLDGSDREVLAESVTGTEFTNLRITDDTLYVLGNRGGSVALAIPKCGCE